MMGVGAKRALDLYRSCAPRQQIDRSEQRPACREHDEGIVHECARPARRNRPQLLSPTLAIVNQRELTPEQWVKRMAYLETSLLTIRIGCTRQPSPMPMWSG